MKNHGGAVQDNAETKMMLKHCLKYQSFVTLIPLILNLVELKMELELKSLELELQMELKTGIELFATATEALTSLPTISKFSFNRGGHNLSCGWLLMLQVCLLSSWDFGPLWCGHKRLWGDTLFPLSRQKPEGLKIVTITVS